jgi:MFS transporter, FSR family, fosmidomycin resistance protein
LTVALVDEPWSGVAVSGAPSVEHELALSHRGYLLFAFVLPLVAAAGVEAGLSLLSDVWGRARLVVLGQGFLAAALAFTAWTTRPWGLTVGLALAGASSGVACGAAQSVLIAGAPDDALRRMVRWSLYCAVGDILTPLVTASAIALGASYRGAMAAIALVVFVQCAGSTRFLAASEAAPVRNTSDPGLSPRPIREVLARALRLPRLWAWLFAAASCTLLDELVIALSTLRLERSSGTGAALATAAATSFAAGSIAGAAMTDRAVAYLRPRAVLVVSALLVAIALIALLSAPGLLSSCVALFFLGMTCAPHHPLAMARAYGELEDQPGTVQALGQLFVVVDVLAPIVLGVVADRFGLAAAVSCLMVQPAVILVCAVTISATPRE